MSLKSIDHSQGPQYASLFAFPTPSPCTRPSITTSDDQIKDYQDDFLPTARMTHKDLPPIANSTPPPFRAPSQFRAAFKKESIDDAGMASVPWVADPAHNGRRTPGGERRALHATPAPIPTESFDQERYFASTQQGARQRSLLSRAEGNCFQGHRPAPSFKDRSGRFPLRQPTVPPADPITRAPSRPQEVQADAPQAPQSIRPGFAQMLRDTNMRGPANLNQRDQPPTLKVDRDIQYGQEQKEAAHGVIGFNNVNNPERMQRPVSTNSNIALPVPEQMPPGQVMRFQPRPTGYMQHMGGLPYPVRDSATNKDEFSRNIYFLPQPPSAEVILGQAQPAVLPTTLSNEFRAHVFNTLDYWLCLTAFLFFSEHQFPIPLEKHKPSVLSPQDRSWNEWAYLLKRLATKRRVPTAVLHGGQIKHMVTLMENSTLVRHSPDDPSQAIDDDMHMLQIISAAVQVVKLLRNYEATFILLELYNQTLNAVVHARF